MKDTAQRLHDYCTAHSTPPPEALQALERETHLKTLAPQMLSGPLQGRVLALLSQLLRPRRVLEVGAFTGYATHCLAEGLHEEGMVDTIEGNPELAYLIQKHLDKNGLSQRVRLHIGDAKQIIPTLEHQYDLVFLDANKREYALYFDLVAPLLQPGGLLLADNVLWSGKVILEKHDEDTRTLDAFNKKVLADPRFQTILLPLRDGLMLARRL